MTSVSGRAESNIRSACNVFCFLIFNLVLVSFGSVTSWGDNEHPAHAKGANGRNTASSRVYLFDVPLDSPMKCDLAKGLPALVRLARVLTGRIDITSVSGCSGAIAPTRQERNHEGSVETMDCNYASLGQNTKYLGATERAAGQKISDAASNGKRQVAKESPTSNPVSFAWEYLETKK